MQSYSTTAILLFSISSASANLVYYYNIFMLITFPSFDLDVKIMSGIYRCPHVTFRVSPVSVVCLFVFSFYLFLLLLMYYGHSFLAIASAITINVLRLLLLLQLLYIYICIVVAIKNYNSLTSVKS